MLASPVAYLSSLVPQRWRWLYGLNPMGGVIEGFRRVLTGRGRALGLLQIVSARRVLLLLTGGFFFNELKATKRIRCKEIAKIEGQHCVFALISSRLFGLLELPSV